MVLRATVSQRPRAETGANSLTRLVGYNLYCLEQRATSAKRKVQLPAKRLKKRQSEEDKKNSAVKLPQLRKPHAAILPQTSVVVVAWAVVGAASSPT